MGEGERDVLKQAPRNPKEPILGRGAWTAIVLQSIALAAATFGALALARLWLDLDSGSAITVTFLTLAFAQLWHVFNMRHRRSQLLRNEITGNRWLWAALALCTLLLAVPPYVPALAHILHLVPPTPIMWAVVAAMSLAPLLVVQTATAALAARRQDGDRR
jgi:Ca2+-transporting ATPase